MSEELSPELERFDRQLAPVSRRYRPELRLMGDRAAEHQDVDCSPVDFLRYSEVTRKQWRALRRHKVTAHKFRHANPAANERAEDFETAQEIMMDYLGSFDTPDNPYQAVVVEDADVYGPSDRYTIVFAIKKEHWQMVHGGK